MNFSIKSPNGTIALYDCVTSLREEYVYQALFEVFGSSAAREMSKAVIYLANEPIAASVHLSTGYTITKELPTPVGAPRDSASHAIKYGMSGGEGLSPEILDRFKFYDFGERGQPMTLEDVRNAGAFHMQGYSVPSEEHSVTVAKKELTAKDLINLATEAANVAGDEWMANARPKYEVYEVDLFGNRKPGAKSDYMLDVCGSGNVQFKDRRSAQYKAFNKAGFIRGNSVVEIPHKYRGRQEMGLAVACAEAAKKSLESNGVLGLRIWSYID